jgi:hypothetical protein
VSIPALHGACLPQPPIDRSESPITDAENLSGLKDVSGPDDISGSEDVREKEEPRPTRAQPQRDDAAKNSRESTAPSTNQASVQRPRASPRRAETFLLEAKDEAIADIRDRVAFLRRHLEDRVEGLRRRSHIIAAFTERILPAIVAPESQEVTKIP